MAGHQPDQGPDFWARARREREAREKERRSARRRRDEEVLQRLETDDAAQVAAHGLEGSPVGNRRSGRVTLGLTTWAKHIARMGRAWAVHPGVDVLRDRPIPDTGPGIDAGRRIFAMACQGAGVRKITKELQQARDALGEYQGEGDPNDTFTGVWIFIRQLGRYYDGVCWSPPRRRATPATASPAGRSTPDRRRKEKGGRPTEYDDIKDQKLVSDWKAADMRHAEFERKRGLPDGEIRRAKDRIRTRERRRRRAK